jgi:hypothetical protein
MTRRTSNAVEAPRTVGSASDFKIEKSIPPAFDSPIQVVVIALPKVTLLVLA